MEFQDKTLKCKDCGADFEFTAGEQEFYKEKGFENEPARCKICRSSRKNRKEGPRELHEVQCAECGEMTQVPFKPRNEKPVYCRDCFEKKPRD